MAAGDPLVGDTIRVHVTVTNPTAGTANPRTFHVENVWIAVTKPDGTVVDLTHSGNVEVPVAGYAYAGTHTVSAGGVHGLQAHLKPLNLAQVDGSPGSVNAVSFTDTAGARPDGSTYNTRTFSDGRAAIVTELLPAVVPTLSALSTG